MRRSIMWGMTVAVGLVNFFGCSSVNKQNKYYSDRSSRLGLLEVPVEDRVRPLLPGERSPAGDPQTSMVRQVQPVAVNWLGGTFSFSMILSRVNDWNEPQYYQDKKFIRSVERQLGKCGGWSCDKAPVTSQLSEAVAQIWTQFEKAMKDQRPEFLQKAILGLSAEAAGKMVERKILTKRPSSWEDLVAAVRKAERDGLVPGEMAYATTVTHRYANLSALGYSPGTCRAVTNPCEVWRERFKWETYTASRPSVLRSTIDQIVHNVELIVREPQLQNFEVENILIMADEEASSVRIPTSAIPPRIRVVVDGPTIYEQKLENLPDRTRITLVGKERVQVPLPESALGPAMYRPGSINPVFRISVDPNYIPQAGYDDQLVLRYSIRTCPSLNRICFGKWHESEARYMPITSDDTNLDVSVGRGQLTQIVYSVARKSSKLYSDSFLRERETDSFYVQ